MIGYFCLNGNESCESRNLNEGPAIRFPDLTSCRNDLFVLRKFS